MKWKLKSIYQFVTVHTATFCWIMSNSARFLIFHKGFVLWNKMYLNLRDCSLRRLFAAVIKLFTAVMSCLIVFKWQLKQNEISHTMKVFCNASKSNWGILILSIWVLSFDCIWSYKPGYGCTLWSVLCKMEFTPVCGWLKRECHTQQNKPYQTNNKKK